MTAPDGQYVDVVLFTPEALATRPDLAETVELVPEGLGLVVIMAYPEYE